MEFILKPIGKLHTPYREKAPFRPETDAEGKFSIEIFEEYTQAMSGLEAFSHLVVLFYFDRSEKTNLLAHPPHLQGRETGLFASRSPNRINKIGMNVVRILSIKGNMIFTSAMDAFDGTPLLDIKPYIPDLDSFPGASRGHTC